MGMGLQQMDIKNDFKGPDMHPLIDFSKTIQTSDESSTEPSNYDNEGLEAAADDDPPWLILQEEKEMAKKLMDNGLETFVQKEGPNQILNLLLEEQIDNVIIGEFFDFDDFGDWISCAAEDEDRRKQNKYLQTTIRKRCQWCFNWKRTWTVRDRKRLQVANCKACKARRKTGGMRLNPKSRWIWNKKRLLSYGSCWISFKMFSPGIRANWDVANMWSIQWIPKDLHCIRLFLTNCLFGRKQKLKGKFVSTR
jgi:hypothetical protein